jgi:hypothetical protein
MNTPSISERQRIDSFCRDLALALRRISGRNVELDASQLPTADEKRSVIKTPSKPNSEGTHHDSNSK